MTFITVLSTGCKPSLPPITQLAEGKDKVRFQRKGAVVLAVIEVNIHRVDVLRLPVNALARRGKPDYLSAQTLHKGEILRFRVADDNVVVSNEESVCHFPLCRKGFTASRRSQNQPVRVFKLLAVAKYHVVALKRSARNTGLPRSEKAPA